MAKQSTATVILRAVLSVIRHAAALGTRLPAPLPSGVCPLRAPFPREADELATRLKSLSGVHEVMLLNGGRLAYLAVDSVRRDDENVTGEQKGN